MKLLKKTAVGQRRVYDIEVEDVHNFYANGINVHNCATAGGVSVIKHDGTVGNLVNYVTAPTRASFVEVGGVSKILTTSRYSNWINMFDIPTGNVNTGNFWSHFAVSGLSFGREFNETKDDFVVGASNALVRYAKDPILTNLNGQSGGNVAYFMTNYTTSTYNTGWLPGNIKGAFLSSTDTASLVGSGELVTNGTFDTDTSGWTAVNSTLSIAANKLQVVSSGAGIAYAEQTLSGLTVGQTYILEATGSIISGSSKAYATIYTGTGTFVANAISNVSAETTGTLTFVASQTSMKVRLQLLTPTGSGDTGLFDNISVKLADADRSVNNKGLIVNGTVTRSPVATGAELVAYSGFTTSNYLEQPYNSDLDFGTGDFCVMGWVKNTGTGVIFERRDAARTGPYINAYLASSTAVHFYAGTSKVAEAAIPSGVWFHLALGVSGGVSFAYVNGVSAKTYSGTPSTVTNTSALTRVGCAADATAPAAAASACLFRISATAPTAEQIARIYQDERPLFQENAACTIAGTSDAVTALAHDSTTNLLHVGSSYGRSVFQGLRRVDAVAGAVGTAISAENGLVVSE